MGDNRPKVYLSKEDFEMIDRAAYWEGFKSPAKFVAAIMRGYIDQRQAGRGAHYPAAKWPKNASQEEEEA